MKVKVLTRNPDEYIRETKKDIHKLPRNYDPSLHPFEAQREYVRALNAVKLERVFAKPFIGSLTGHQDGVSCMKKHSTKLSILVSGAYDGEVRLWDLPTKSCMRATQAHEGQVRGIDFLNKGNHYVTVGDDKTIKFWSLMSSSMVEPEQPLNTIISKTIITGVSCHRDGVRYATCGETCQLWEESRNEPVRVFNWGTASLHSVVFNHVETSVLATCGSDRSIIIYDTRETGPVRKVVLALRTNQICWNPMEAFVFTAANEDYNLYSFDTRNLKTALQVHKDHVSAVISVDYSPTGLEFVSGGYDRTVRIFPSSKVHSREVYHTKRMQKITSVCWSQDNKYIFTGSDEMNIRIWKANASEKLGVMKPRERDAMKYNEALKKKFESFPQVKRIARHRQVPKHVYNARREHRTIYLKQKRKEKNRREHSKPGSVPFLSEKRKPILEEEK